MERKFNAKRLPCRFGDSFQEKDRAVAEAAQPGLSKYLTSFRCLLSQNLF